jgi:hypothetical protein
MIRVLADRHHAGLFHSLQLLFARIGRLTGDEVRVETPIGHEWWDAGFWRFGEGYGDDRLARQFLNVDLFTAGLFGDTITNDPEFPESPIYGVTLNTALEHHYDFVVATVQDNQHGLARFAREMGARFVLAVGNTGQMIDWGLDPLVINSSEMPVLGRGVNVGQEFDSDGLFAREGINNATRIGSFVNCMTSIACWPLLDHARSAPDLDVRVHGIDGPDGNIKPISTIANIMRGCGWGWHDKEHGDGFGHVIHYWAAIGRPLIGHASHYKGKRAEALWQDGVTCIDLDRHPIAEALEMVRSIASEPARHNDMSVAIRRAFDEECDWDRDAASVAELLGLAVTA